MYINSKRRQFVTIIKEVRSSKQICLFWLNVFKNGAADQNWKIRNSNIAITTLQKQQEIISKERQNNRISQHDDSIKITFKRIQKKLEIKNDF